MSLKQFKENINEKMNFEETFFIIRETDDKKQEKLDNEKTNYTTNFIVEGLEHEEIQLETEYKRVQNKMLQTDPKIIISNKQLQDLINGLIDHLNNLDIDEQEHLDYLQNEGVKVVYKNMERNGKYDVSHIFSFDGN